MRFEDLETRHVGQPQVQHHTIARLVGHCGECRLASISDHDLQVAMPEQLANAHLFGGVVLDDQQAFASWRGVHLDSFNGGLQAFGCRRLGNEREGPASESVLAIFVERDNLNGYVARLRIVFQLAEHGPSEHVRQEHIERYRRRPELLG